MTRKTKSAVVTLEKETSSVDESPLYGVALLRVAMELKKSTTQGQDVEEILAGVLRRMGLAEESFKAFLEQNGGLLRTIAQRKQY